MIQFLRSIFKKPKPKKIIEVVEKDEPPKREVHHFHTATDMKYCSILGYENSQKEQGMHSIRIAWRNPKRIKIGDFIIINNKDSQKTLRLVKITQETEDVKLGFAHMLK